MASICLGLNELMGLTCVCRGINLFFKSMMIQFADFNTMHAKNYAHGWHRSALPLPISFRIIAQALGQSYDCPSACEVILKDMDKYTPWMLNIWWYNYNKTYSEPLDISRTLVGNKIVDHSDVFGALPVGAAPTTSSFST